MSCILNGSASSNIIETSLVETIYSFTLSISLIESVLWTMWKSNRWIPATIHLKFYPIFIESEEIPPIQARCIILDIQPHLHLQYLHFGSVTYTVSQRLKQ